MNIEKDKIRLSQKHHIEVFKKPIKMTDMVTVYFQDYADLHNYGLYPALIPLDEKTRVLSKYDWDLGHESGYPSYYEYSDGSSEYSRYGNDDGIEPLVIDRVFYDMKESYQEISEEFRLFHKLYFDQKNNNYLKLDHDGNESLIITVSEDKIQIRAKELREFLMAKDMYLSLQFDYREHSMHSLSDLDIEEGSGNDKTEDMICWSCYYGDFRGLSELQAFSRLLGKYLITPISKSVTNDKNDKSKKYVDFIIDIDEEGSEITHTSNPGCLSDFFGNNPDSPNYLTPVEFRKSVLEKYYQEPSKYSVEDSYLRCGSLWGLQIDNHHDDKVCVWLGDLGRDLSYNEQFYWRSYNIAPKGGVSKTYAQRQLLAQFTSSDRLEDIFKIKYDNLLEACTKSIGWSLLLPLGESDKYHFDCLRIPSTNEQRDFDNLVLSLTKILTDSLNEKDLNKFIDKEEINNIKGSIAKLEKVLNLLGRDDYDKHISFLRKLQNLRSSSTAHRKGSNYTKIAKEFGIDDNDLKSIFKTILLSSIELLDYYALLVSQNTFKKS